MMWSLSELLLFDPSEYVWCDPCGRRPVDRNSWRSFYGSQLCGSSGAPVPVPRHGISRATTAGPTGEATAAAEAAAAGEKALSAHTHPHTPELYEPYKFRYEKTKIISCLVAEVKVLHEN